MERMVPRILTNLCGNAHQVSHPDVPVDDIPPRAGCSATPGEFVVQDAVYDLCEVTLGSIAMLTDRAFKVTQCSASDDARDPDVGL
jgi:hypothetical protein